MFVLRLGPDGSIGWTHGFGGYPGPATNLFDRMPSDGTGGFFLAGGMPTHDDFGAQAFRTDSSGKSVWGENIGAAAGDRTSFQGAIEAPQGGLLLWGQTPHASGSAQDPYFVDLAHGGQTLWTRQFTTVSGQQVAGVSALDGGWLVSLEPPFRSFPASALVVARLDSGGAVPWIRSYPYGTANNQGFATVVPAANGGFFVLGDDSYDDPGPIQVIRIASDGSVLWRNGYTAPRALRLTAKLPTADGGLLLGGTVPSPDRMLALRITSTGDASLARTYVTPSNAQTGLDFALPTADGGFLLAGSSSVSSECGFSCIENKAAIYLVKTDAYLQTGALERLHVEP